MGNSYLAQVPQISAYIVENDSLSESFLQLSFISALASKVIFSHLFWMPCTPHPHMPSLSFFCLALWLLLQSRSRWRVRPSFSFCSSVPRESEPFPWLLPLILSSMKFRNLTFQLSIGMSLCSAGSLHWFTHVYHFTCSVGCACMMFWNI